MALIIGETSFVSVAEADAYALAHGLSAWPQPPAEGTDTRASDKEGALVRAADWLNALAWRGARSAWDQPLCFPRKGLHVDGALIPEDAIPAQVKAAQVEAAALFITGEDLFASVERGGRVEQETVGPITIRYFDDASAGKYFPALAGLLAPFLTKIPGQEGQASYKVLKVAP